MIFFLIAFALPLGGLLDKIFGVEGEGSGNGDSYGIGNERTTRVKRQISDTERIFPSSSKQPTLRYEGKVKQEEGTEAVSDLPPVNQGAEADDEDEDDDGWQRSVDRDSGIGTSYDDGVFREGSRKRAQGREEA